MPGWRSSCPRGNASGGSSGCAAAGRHRCADWTSAVPTAGARSSCGPSSSRSSSGTEGLVTREAAVLRLLAGLAGRPDVPAATLVAADATARYCDHPSLLMSHLPGTDRAPGRPGADARAELMTRQLLRIHRVPVTARQRPRTYPLGPCPSG
ncbi:phosphotransferase [Streptomyces thermoviolaceus subsp. thermoviolaceus]|uniref:Phosphotransferase n=1 Tax=Streptomyces thermoviolaceus subsp. thermoviolaceus TaxID=66860 RepID=A0ABX0YND2_STRTL|nr:phosphotransferase [Streptomyces thermoviolaceus subsp. thermoviolaceus]